MAHDFEMPSNEELTEQIIPRFVAWPDLFGVEVPIRGGKPLLGEPLHDWIDDHKHYLGDEAKGAEFAAMGLALMIVKAEMEQGFTGGRGDGN